MGLAVFAHIILMAGFLALAFAAYASILKD